MSFFDEVETTVANTRFLQAAEDGDAPVKLSSAKYDDLKEFEAKLKEQGVVSIERCLRDKTVAYHLFKKYLDSNGLDSFTKGMKAVDIFRTAHRGNRHAKSTEALAGLRALVGDAGGEEEKVENPNFFGSAAMLQEYDTIQKWMDTEEQGGERLHGDLYDRVVKNIEEHLKGLVWDKFVESAQYKLWIEMEDYAKKKVSMKDFRVFRVLGRGAFGAVSAVQRIETHQIYAMKEMGKKQVKMNSSEWMCINEMKVLTKMRSPFVLNLKYSFHDETSLFLVFDMCSGGDLKFHLGSMKGGDRCFPPDRAKFYAACVLLGLAHLHSFDIVYRDLKPDNILLMSSGYCKISDLGLTIKLRKNKTLKHLAGTPGYMAPEIVQKSGTYKASDWWGFGVFLYEMLGGHRPKNTANDKNNEWSPFATNQKNEELAQGDKCPQGVLKYKVEYPADKFAAPAKDLLEKLFVADPKARMGAESHIEIQEHPYFNPSMDWAKLEAMELPPPYMPDAHTVNAHSIAEVGEFNQGKFKKIKLTPEDEKNYESTDPSKPYSFTYISEENIQLELVEALIKQEKNPPKEHAASSNDPKNCCAIL